jgi:hypothetical protein
MADDEPLEWTESFEADLAELARITGASAEELPCDFERTMVGFPIGQGLERNVAILVREHQEAFLRRGCFICHYCGCLAAVPTGDVFRAVEEIGTEGVNYSISTRQIVDWLRQTASRHPLRLITVADDEIKGDFLAPSTTPSSSPDRSSPSVPPGNRMAWTAWPDACARSAICSCGGIDPRHSE